MKNKNVLFICQAAMIAALYVVLTFVANAFGLASGAIQIRLSEVLTILPWFTPAAIPGLAIGCLLANWLTGCVILDILFGTAATFIGAWITYGLRRLNIRWLAPVPPIVANTLIVPWVLRFAYEMGDAIPYLMLTVGIGEFLSCGVLGMILLFSLDRLPKSPFKTASP